MLIINSENRFSIDWDALADFMTTLSASCSFRMWHVWVVGWRRCDDDIGRIETLACPLRAHLARSQTQSILDILCVMLPVTIADYDYAHEIVFCLCSVRVGCTVRHWDNFSTGAISRRNFFYFFFFRGIFRHKLHVTKFKYMLIHIWCGNRSSIIHQPKNTHFSSPRTHVSQCACVVCVRDPPLPLLMIPCVL